MSEVTVVLNVNEVAVTKQVTDLEVVQLVQEVGLTSPGPQGPPGPTGPAGAAGGSVFEHDQVAPSASWLITHNLGRFPHISVLDGSNNLVLTDVEYTSLNTAVLTFPLPVTGKAVCS